MGSGLVFFLIHLLCLISGKPQSSNSIPDYDYLHDDNFDSEDRHIDDLYSDEAAEEAEDAQDISEEEKVSSDVPNFLSKGGERFGKLGETVELTCQVNQLGGREMIWFRENGDNQPEYLVLAKKKVAEDVDINEKLLGDGEGGILVISNFQEKHAGNYTCSIADERVASSLTFSLSVLHDQPGTPASQLTGSSRHKLPSSSLLFGLASFLIFCRFF